jgi:transposase InsO family protein
MPKRIIFDRESMFTGSFWTSFQEALGTQLKFSIAYNPEADGKIERMNQIFEFMLRTYVMDEHKCRKEFLPLVEFAYNKNYQSTIKMVSLEFLYGRLCQTPFSWDRIEDRVLVGLEMIQEMEEQLKTIRKMIK